jgi:hypothetical protein
VCALFAHGALSAGADLNQFDPFGSRRMLQIETPDAKFLRLRTSAHLCPSNGSKVREALERIAQHVFLVLGKGTLEKRILQREVRPYRQAGTCRVNLNRQTILIPQKE